MRVIALDTTTRGGSVALVEDDRVIEERAGDLARSHAEQLPSAVVELARAHGVALPDVDLFGVASGPGSFTGLRIGIASAQGLAFVGHRRILGVSALEALAHARSLDISPGTVVAAWMDAHRREVFAAVYRVTRAAPFSADRLEEVEGPTVGDPASTLARWTARFGVRPTLFVGDGATLYEDVIRRAAGGARVVDHPLLAGTIGRLTVVRAAEARDPADVRPLYVRRPDAEIARDKP
jgi:tRNA threonylcarbamoyladenosine biosynthesis protein TsaB